MTPKEQADLKRELNDALRTAYVGLDALIDTAQDEIMVLHLRAAGEIDHALRAASGQGGMIPLYAVPLLMATIDTVIANLRDAELALITKHVAAAAENGAKVATAMAASSVPAAVVSVPAAAPTAVLAAGAVVNTPGTDGLVLSDRVWRIFMGVRAELERAIREAIAAGASATEAAREAVRRGLGVSDEVLDQIEKARAGALGEEAKAILASPEAKAYANAVRVARTEMDKANIMASRAAIYETEGVVGTRFMLSPSHPRFDVCDMHASVNLYGLGKGVYPPGRSPLPAHPNTLSFEEAVFEWEVTDADRGGREDLMDWLRARSDDELYGVMQSERKVAALRAGLLQPEEIDLPWRELKARYESQLPTAA